MLLNSMLGVPGLSRSLVLLQPGAGLIWTFSYQFLIHIFKQSAYSSSPKMRAERIIALSYMMDDSAPVQRKSSRDCTKTAYFLFRLTSSEYTYRRSILLVST